MLLFKNRDGTLYQTLPEFDFSSFTANDINEVTIAGNADEYIGKIAYIYDNDNLIGSGIVMNYDFDKNRNNSTIQVFPLIYDLRQDFIRDGLGNFVVYYDDTIENILSDIITQYRSTATNPILSIGSLAVTGQNIKYTFNFNNYLEGFNTIIGQFLNANCFVKVDADGVITLGQTGTEKHLVYGSDIKKIKYSKKTDEIVNYVSFDNKIAGSGHITGIYQDATSIAAYGKRVHYLDDSRIKYQQSADELAGTYLAKNKDPKIIVDEIITESTTIGLYDKITIDNWEKTISDSLYVVNLVYNKGGQYILKIGSEIRRSTLNNQAELESQTALTESVSDAMPVVPAYIQSTYIDSVEVRSPIIKGNLGYIYDTLKVGPSGIVIDGLNKLIKSSNYSAGSAGWQVRDTGDAEFNNATLRGNLLAGTVNINSNFTVDASGNVRGNDFTNKTIFFEKLGSTPSFSDGKMWCEGNPTNKVLWGYFGGDTTKQQVSTSRMQASSSFDRTAGTSMTITTWFQPRLMIFNGFFENTGSQIYGTTNGQAGSVASSQGFCNALSLQYGSVTNVVTGLSFGTKTNAVSDLVITQTPANQNFHFSNGSCTSTTDGCVVGLPLTLGWNNNSLLNSASWSNATVPIIQQIKTANVTDSFAADSVTKNAYAYVSSWTDTGITIQVVVGSGWRLCGNITVFG